uniref:NADH-ubiquinone oxidoreductase chain 4 n=1 Tax=Dolichovespula kuami TaxID=2901320 RepID=A0A9E7BVB1_9HYME|nr:NADH dehydrogenase subunit 4 [Dolichovespula kuami]UGB89881.1 NADH dehydrogenase subunit 4 [Dolichovespula kuami]
MMKLIFCLLMMTGMLNFKISKVSKSLVFFFLAWFMMFFWVSYSSNLWAGGHIFFFYDYNSYVLVILSLWISGCMMIMNLSKLMEFLIIILMFFLSLCFFSVNLLMFYLMFESGLLPIFFLILYGGYSFERYEAIMYMFMFTVLSSIPLLWMLLYLFINYHSLMIMMMIFLSMNLNWLLFFLCLLGFIVKLPMFIFHIWLPKAHVEAPVYGSMILAGVLLKLGSYGMLRMAQIFPLNMSEWSIYLISLGILGGMIMSMVCLIQVDMKMMVAYSSVVHMSLLISGMVTMSKIGLIGSLMMMIAHGLCSSGMFYLVNMNYERFGSRLIYLNKGTLSIYPTLTMFWFLFCSSNLSAPVSLNLIGEIFLLTSLVSWSILLIMFLMLYCFFSAAYSLYLFSMSQHGNSLFFSFNYKFIFVSEYLVLILHWFPLNIMFFGLDMFNF